MESDLVSRLKQPSRPTTPIVTTVTVKPTASRQRHTTKANDHDDDGADDDTLLILFQIES